MNILYISWLIVLLITRFIHPILEKLNPTLKNWDVIHSNVKDMSNYGWIDDVIVLLMGVILLVNFKNVNFLETSKAVTFFYSLRLLCILTTQLADPEKKNHCKAHNHKRLGACTDKFFSGHTSIMLILASALSMAFPKYKIFYWIMTMFVSMFAIITRDHYTIDVIMPWVLFYFYTNKTFKL